MKTRNIIFSAVAGLLALSVVSCSNKLDIPQHGVLDYNTFYKTDEQALEADAAMYLEILNGGGLGWKQRFSALMHTLTLRPCGAILRL